ncbi:MAG: hypothetical protein ACYDC4_15520 [Candidatus Dormibacteria bacterium]
MQADVARIKTEQQQQEQLLAQLDTVEQSLDDERSMRTDALVYLAQVQAQDEQAA